MSKKDPLIPEEEKREVIREYTSIQYDRIDQLQAQRFNFSNLILGLSGAALAFSYPDQFSPDTQNPVQQFLIPIFLILANLFAIVFIFKTRRYIKMHQKRANIAREQFGPLLNEINNKANEAIWPSKKKKLKGLKFIRIIGSRFLNLVWKSESMFSKKEMSTGIIELFKRSWIYVYLHVIILIISLVVPFLV